MLSHNSPGVPNAIWVGSVEKAMVGVSVEASVAGGSVGGSGVGEKDAAVNVNSATTVYAADVRTAFTSAVGSMGVAGAHEARRIAVSRKKTNTLTFIAASLYCSTEMNLVNTSGPNKFPASSFILKA